MTVQLSEEAKDGGVELAPVGIETMHLACIQTCAKSEKSSTERFLGRTVVDLRIHELCHREHDFLFRDLTSDSNRGGVALFV